MNENTTEQCNHNTKCVKSCEFIKIPHKSEIVDGGTGIWEKWLNRYSSERLENNSLLISIVQKLLPEDFEKFVESSFSLWKCKSELIKIGLNKNFSI